MRDLSTQIRTYIDAIAEPIELAEARDETRPLRSLDIAEPRRTRQGRRILVGAAVVLLLVLGSVLLSRHDDEGVQTGPAQPTVADQQAEFEVLGMTESTFAMGYLASAVDDDGLRALWSNGGFNGAPPDVDLTRWVVVSMTIPDDACPPTLTGFTREGSIWTPVFVEPSGACNYPLTRKTFVVAINRAMVAPEFSLRLPAIPPFFESDRVLEVEVPPVDADAPTVSADDDEAEARVAFQQLVAQELAADRLPVDVDERAAYAAAVLAGENPPIPLPPASADDARPKGDPSGEGIVWIYPDVSAPELLAQTWSAEALDDQVWSFTATFEAARYDPNYSQSSDTGFELLEWESVSVDGETASISAVGKFHKYRTPNAVVPDPADWIESDRMQIDATLVRSNAAWRLQTFEHHSLENSGP